MGATEFDRAVRRLAGQQHWVFSAQQVHALGGTKPMVRRRLLREDWNRPAHGVYRLTSAPQTWRQFLQIALFVAGSGAAVSHRAAAALWRLPGFTETHVEIVAPHGHSNHRLPVGRLHESRFLPERHIKVIDGLRVVTVERMLCEVAAVVSPGLAERAVDNSLCAGLTACERLWRVWGELAAPGRRGVGSMRAILADRLPGYMAPASELEAMFLKTVRVAGLPDPDKQVDLGGEQWIGRVDFVYRMAKLVIEVDGRVGHASHLDAQRDVQRDVELAAAGWRVMRFKWEDLVMRPDWVVTKVRQALAGTLAA